MLAGDRVSVPRRAKVEIVLADQNILRVDGGSELILERLAASPDRQDRATVIRLLSGNVQLIVAADSLGDELPRVETPNATIYPQYFGSYRLTADAGYSQVVVRSGTAQVVTDTGSWKVKADEEAVVDDRNPDKQAEIREAGAFDTLERWGRQLDDEYAGGRPAGERRRQPALRRGAAQPLRRLDQRQRRVVLAAAGGRRLAPLLAGAVDLHPERPDLDLLGALGLGALPLRQLGLPGRLRLGLAAGLRLVVGLGLLVLGRGLRRLVPDRLLHRATTAPSSAATSASAGASTAGPAAAGTSSTTGASCRRPTSATRPATARGTATPSGTPTATSGATPCRSTAAATASSGAASSRPTPSRSGRASGRIPAARCACCGGGARPSCRT